MTTDIEERVYLQANADNNTQCETSSMKKPGVDVGCAIDPEHAGDSWKDDGVDLQYRIEETPPLHFTILFALQVRLLVLLATKICAVVRHLSYLNVCGLLWHNGGEIPDAFYDFNRL